MALSNLDCGSGSFDLASLCFTSLGMCSCAAQTDVLSAVTSLARGAGWRGLVCLGPARMKQSATCQGTVQREALKSHDLLQSRVPVVAILVRLMFCCVLLYQADRLDVVCHLVGRGCGMMR